MQIKMCLIVILKKTRNTQKHWVYNMLDFLHIIFLLLILGWNVTGFLEIYLQIVFSYSIYLNWFWVKKIIRAHF